MLDSSSRIGQKFRFSPKRFFFRAKKKSQNTNNAQLAMWGKNRFYFRAILPDFRLKMLTFSLTGKNPTRQLCGTLQATKKNFLKRQKISEKRKVQPKTFLRLVKSNLVLCRAKKANFQSKSGCLNFTARKTSLLCFRGMKLSLKILRFAFNSSSKSRFHAWQKTEAISKTKSETSKK